MMITLLAPRVWKDIAAAASECKRPAHVAVAYFGEKGDRLLPLPTGSSLAIDASIPTLAAGSTCPAALERLRRKGVDVYSVQHLHAKVYAFDRVAFIGSANASHRSDVTLIEAVLRVNTREAILSVRDFVDSLCFTKLSGEDLAELSRYYKTPKVPTQNPAQSKYSTLLMELTKEQGGGRETQVQPPKAVWESYFQIRIGKAKLPTLSLINEQSQPVSVASRDVVAHHHNYTIELPGAELPRPAILQMRRVGRNKYSYRVHRPTDSTYSSIDTLLKGVRNPLWQPGRRWIMI
jgi:hypothetical protein